MKYILYNLKSRLHCFPTVLAVSLVLCLCSCDKTCVCKGYDGGEYPYTEEEVDARGVTCPNMIFQAGQQYYSVCDWE